MDRLPRLQPARELCCPELAGYVDGFDCLLVAFMAATAVLGWLRRQLVLLTAFTTGVLLICDAWFDILTAGLGRNLAVPMLTAALGNLPLAAIMITGAVRILRLTAIRLFFSRPRDAAVAPAVAAVTGPARRLVAEMFFSQSVPPPVKTSGRAAAAGRIGNSPNILR
jgi:hypothetical protein